MEPGAAPPVRLAHPSRDVGPAEDRPRAGLLESSVLRHKHFRNVWLAAFVSSVGGWMESVGIGWVVAQETLKPDWVAAGNPGSKLMLSYLAIAQLGPTMLLGIIGGLTADRVNRKSLLLVTQAFQMVIAAAVAVASFTGHATPWVLMGLMLALGVSMAFNAPAWQTLTPRLVPREELTRAITLNGIQFNLARVVGPAAAGVLMWAYGAPVLFALNTISFIAVLIAVATTPDSPAPKPDGARAWSQIADALRFVLHERGPRAVFIGMVLFSVLAGPLVRMLPLFVSEVYHAEERAYGVLLAIMGVGAVIGGLSLKLIPDWYPKHHLIPLSVTLAGFTMTGFAACGSIYGASVFLFFAGAFWLWSFNSSMAAMQMLVGDAMRGRVLAICNTAVFGAMPLGSLIVAWIGDVASIGAPEASRVGIGVQAGVGAVAAVLTVAGLVMLTWRTPEVDGFKPGEPRHARRPGLMRGFTGTGHRPGR